MERDPFEGGSDVGRDLARDLGDEPPGSIRDTAPDVLAPIDADAPVSGHVPATEARVSAVDSPEQDWTVARDLVRPAFRPVGTQGLELESIDRDTLSAHAAVSHAQPLVDMGPAGIPVVYTIPAGGFDIIVNGDHLLSWGIEPTELQDAALRNLASWAASRPVVRGIVGRAPAHQLRYGRWPGRRPHPAARRLPAPVQRARRRQPRAGRPPGAEPARGRGAPSG